MLLREGEYDPDTEVDDEPYGDEGSEMEDWDLSFDYIGITSLDTLASAMVSNALFWRKVASRGFELARPITADGLVYLSHPEGETLWISEGEYLKLSFGDEEE